MPPIVSVALITRNRAYCLPALIDSIRQQDYDDFEFIVVDDASTDNTAELIDDVSRVDPRFRYIPLSVNHGIAGARNVSFRAAQGRYVALADSDDPWRPEKLRLQIQALEAHPEIDALFVDYLNIDHVRGGTTSAFAATQLGMQHLVTQKVDDDLAIIVEGLERGVLRSNFIAPSTMVIRKELFQRVGEFDETLKGAEDLEFHIRASVGGATYAFLNRPLVERHVLQDSVTAVKYQPLYNRIAALNTIERVCRTAGRNDLLPFIGDARNRAFLGIMAEAATTGNRPEIVRGFRLSLQHGFTMRSLMLLLVGLLGPRVMNTLMRVRARRAPREHDQPGTR